MKMVICFIATFCIIAGCRNNPNLKKDQLISELTSEIITDELTKEVVELPDYYTPPAGVMHQPVRMRSSSYKSFDMQGVLKNERTVKLSDFGTEVIYQRITEPIINIRNIYAVPEGYLLSAFAGSVYIFDKEFKSGKKVIEDDLVLEKVGEMYWTTFKNVIMDWCYDNHSGHIFGVIYKLTDDKREFSTGTIHINDLKEVSAPLTPDNLKNRIMASKQMNILPVRNGYATLNSNTLYTLDIQGDTMCVYSPVKEVSLSNRTLRRAESSTQYLYQNHSYFRPAYTNKIYQITDFNTFTEVYEINFGDKQVTPEEGPDTRVSLADKLLLDDWFETDDYILMRFTQDYDCPNTRKSGSVKFHQAIYDKKTKAFYSFTNHTKLSEPYNIPNDIDSGLDFWPNKCIDGKMYMVLSGEKYKEMLKSKPKHVQAFPDISDEEVVLITII